MLIAMPPSAGLARERSVCGRPQGVGGFPFPCCGETKAFIVWPAIGCGLLVAVLWFLQCDLLPRPFQTEIIYFEEILVHFKGSPNELYPLGIIILLSSQRLLIWRSCIRWLLYTLT